MCGTGPGGYGTLATTATTTITYPLPFSAGHEEVLTQVEVSIKETLDTTTTESMMYAEVFLVRFAGVTRILIDRGVVVGGFGQRNFVGMVGRVGYSDGDYLQIVLNNFSLGTVSYNIQTAYESWLSEDDAYKGNCQGMTRLAKKTRVFYAARRVNTQGAGGGGALVTRISTSTGQCAMLIGMEIIGAASAGSTLSCYVTDEDGANVTKLGVISAGATRVMYLPSIGSTSSTHDGTAQSIGMIIGPGQFIKTYGSAALNTETHTVSCMFELLGHYSALTWDTTGSGGTPSLAASTVSDANTYHVQVIDS